MKNRKKLSPSEIDDLLAEAGAIPSKEERENRQKKTLVTCEEADGLISKNDKSVFDALVAYFHVLSCDNCRTKYRKRKEGQ